MKAVDYWATSAVKHSVNRQPPAVKPQDQVPEPTAGASIAAARGSGQLWTCSAPTAVLSLPKTVTGRSMRDASFFYKSPNYTAWRRLGGDLLAPYSYLTGGRSEVGGF